MNVIKKTVELPDGRTISIETGKLAKQADGAVMLTMGNTMLLATVCAAKDAVPGTDFMPLQVEYREKFAAAGRFPGGFTKREGKASDYEILTCRLVDRALRPLFPSNYHAEVYVNVILYSADGVDMPDALAGFAASAALAVSDIPFEGPISEVRVARVNGEYVVNPTFAQLEQADMDIMVGATEENIMMVEGEMKEVTEQDLLNALKVAHEAIKPMCRLQKELEKEAGKEVKREYCHEVNDEDLREEVKKACYDAAYRIAQEGNRDKHAREDAFMEIRENFKLSYAEAHADLSEDELLLTAKDSIRDKEEGYDSGADSYLTKPFSATLLNSRVRNLLDMRRKLARMIVGKAKDEERGMPAGEVRLSKLDEEFIRRFTDVVTEHISQDKLDIPFMADKMNMSVSTLYRKLKGLTGLSGNEFIRKIKLKRSLYLMTEQGLNVTEAAYSSGFNDVGHFRRCFKEEYGVSPSKYTKR